MVAERFCHPRVLCGGGVGGGLRHRSRGEATRWSEREGGRDRLGKKKKKKFNPLFKK